MDRKSVRIVFMGTPEFAEASLRSLVEGGFNVVAVVTVADKPIGRHGSVLQPSPVKQYAVEQGIPVLQPEKLKDETFLAQLRSFNADLQIVVAFRMLPEVVWAMPRLGTFNLHGSLLPQYRGAAPINWAVINGDAQTGVTTFFLKHEIDTGDIIYQERIPVGPYDDAGIVHDRLMELGSRLVVRTADDVISGNVHPVPQPELPDSEMRPAPKLFKENCRIDWNRPASDLHNFVRGLSPYPAAWTQLIMPDGRAVDFKILKTDSVISRQGLAVGSIDTDGRTYARVATAEGLLNLLEIQMSGKKRMPVKDFLCGFSQLGACHFE